MDLRPQLRRYRDKFQKQAVAVAKKQDRQDQTWRRWPKYAHDRPRSARSRRGLHQRGHHTRRRSGHSSGWKNLSLISRDEIIPEHRPSGRPPAGSSRPFGKALAAVPIAVAQAGGRPSARSLPKPPNFQEYLRGEEGFASRPWQPPRRPRDHGPSWRSMPGPPKNSIPRKARAILACNLIRNLLGLSALVIDFQALRRRPRSFKGHGDAQVFRPRIAGRRARIALGPGRAIRHDRLRREHHHGPITTAGRPTRAGSTAPATIRTC